MKKIPMILFLIISGTVIGCGAVGHATASHAAENPAAENNLDYDNFDGFWQESAFEANLEDNPIDKTYQENISELSSTDTIQTEQNEYYQAWLYDIDRTKQAICGYLSQEDEQLFLDYCQAWEEYQKVKFQWEQSQYYEKGSMNRIMVTDYRAAEAKEFAFKLKRYWYTYTATVEFFNNGYVSE